MKAKGFWLVLVSAAIWTMAMMPGIAQAQTLTIDMAALVAPSHSFSLTAPSMVSEVDKASGGKIKLTISFGGVHGNDREETEAIILGNLKMAWLTDMGMASVVSGIGFVNLPYLFPTYESVDKYYFNGFIGEEVQKRLMAKGVRVLGWLENDYRNLSNSRRPISQVSDLKGLKIRVPEFPMLISFFKKLGAYPTPMAFTELLTGLQQGTIDGQDNGIVLTYSSGLYQAQKYFTLTHHSYSGGAIIVNEQFWQSLTAEQRNIISSAAKKAGQKQVAMNRGLVDTYNKKMTDTGIKFSELTPGAQTAFKKAAAEVWKEYNDKYGKDFMDRLNKEMGQ
jgi:TRAP-type transport system periplasmic protein